MNSASEGANNELPHTEEFLYEHFEHYRELINRKRLYNEGVRRWPHLPDLAMRWFLEISMDRTGKPDELWFSKNQPGYLEESSVERPPLDEGHPVQMENGQMLLVWLGGERSPAGYKTAMVLSESLRTDKAVLAALTALEAEGTDPKRVRLGAEVPYVEALLRYYRPEFDTLPNVDRNALAERTCIHLNAFLDSLEKLMAFLEHGDPYTGLPTKKLGDIRRDVRAAELKYIDGLKNREIGEKLGIPKPEPYDDRKYTRLVREAARRGKKKLEEALGGERFQEYIDRSKAEIARWNSLSAEEQQITKLADLVDESPEMFRYIYARKLKDIFSDLSERS